MFALVIGTRTRRSILTTSTWYCAESPNQFNTARKKKDISEGIKPPLFTDYMIFYVNNPKGSPKIFQI